MQGGPGGSILLLVCLLLSLPDLTISTRHGSKSLCTVFTLGRPSGKAIKDLMAKASGRPHNHDFAGSTNIPGGCMQHGTPRAGLHLIEHTKKIGRGEKDYNIAKHAILEWRVMENLQWAGIEKDESGDGVVTFAKCYGGLMWVINPCREVYRSTDLEYQDSVISQVAYSTLKGHLIRGEERFAVHHFKGDDSVVFSIRSISQGSGILGSLLFPLMGGMQRRFFRDQVVSMEATMRRSKPVVL